MELNKWYLDFTSGSGTGFFYVITVKFGFIRFGASFVFYREDGINLRSFKFSNIKSIGRKTVLLGNSALTVNPDSAVLRISHKEIELNGIWIYKSSPLLRIKKPILKCGNGWSDWKVWNPYSHVSLTLGNDKFNGLRKGTGYMDFVRYDFPLGKNPIKKIYWGRVHGVNSWKIFFYLSAQIGDISQYSYNDGANNDILIETRLNEAGDIKSFIVKCSGDNPEKVFVNEVLDTIEDQELLENKSWLKILPKKLKRIISSDGSDRKYRVRCIDGNEEFLGIMEEVSWNG